jgi:hypothetical protein
MARASLVLEEGTPEGFPWLVKEDVAFSDPDPEQKRPEAF